MRKIGLVTKIHFFDILGDSIGRFADNLRTADGIIDAIDNSQKDAITLSKDAFKDRLDDYNRNNPSKADKLTGDFLDFLDDLSKSPTELVADRINELKNAVPRRSPIEQQMAEQRDRRQPRDPSNAQRDERIQRDIDAIVGNPASRPGLSGNHDWNSNRNPVDQRRRPDQDHQVRRRWQRHLGQIAGRDTAARRALTPGALGPDRSSKQRFAPAKW